MVSGFIGETAVMPCEVDLPNCGKVYFITWTKNVSNEWKREFLYSDGVARAMGDFANPDRATFSLNNHSAHLKLHGLTVHDEGTYKCDVTYVRGKCPSLSFTRLYTLSKYIYFLFIIYIVLISTVNCSMLIRNLDTFICHWLPGTIRI